MSRRNTGHGNRLSLRFAVLIWLAGGVVGWGMIALLVSALV